MNGQRSSEYLEGLLHELRALPGETEWLEFKESYAEPQDIGEYISALANSAALAGKAAAYLVWGIRDSDHAVVGTTFEPQAARKGNEELESWLLRLLEPKIDFHFFRMETEAGPVVLTEIARAIQHPVRFAGREYIRVGSYKKNLKDYPEKDSPAFRHPWPQLLPRPHDCWVKPSMRVSSEWSPTAVRGIAVTCRSGRRRPVRVRLFDGARF